MANIDSLVEPPDPRGPYDRYALAQGLEMHYHVGAPNQFLEMRLPEGDIAQPNADRLNTPAYSIGSFSVHSASLSDLVPSGSIGRN